MSKSEASNHVDLCISTRRLINIIILVFFIFVCYPMDVVNVWIILCYGLLLDFRLTKDAKSANLKCRRVFFVGRSCNWDCWVSTLLPGMCNDNTAILLIIDEMVPEVPPIPCHVHAGDVKDGRCVGHGKTEAYFFPPLNVPPYNMDLGPVKTRLGLKPGVTRESVST